jgi:hypothetical protein
MGGRNLYCGGCNHRAAEGVAKKNAEMWKTAGGEVKEVGTSSGSEDKGQEAVNKGMMRPLLMENALI